MIEGMEFDFFDQVPDTVRVDKSAFLTMHRILAGEILLDSTEAGELRKYITAKWAKLGFNCRYRVNNIYAKRRRKPPSNAGL
jgi:hypothetical protein